VSDGESGGYLSGQFAGSGIGNAAFGDNLFERLAFDHFHDQIRSLCGLLDAQVMDGDDAGVRKLADHPGFAKENVTTVAPSEPWGKQFYGDGTIDEGVMTADDAAVGANAESFVNLVTTDLHNDFSSVRRYGATLDGRIEKEP
jgi:hypothetical protein